MDKKKLYFVLSDLSNVEMISARRPLDAANSMTRYYFEKASEPASRLYTDDFIYAFNMILNSDFMLHLIREAVKPLLINTGIKPNCVSFGKPNFYLTKETDNTEPTYTIVYEIINHAN